MEKNLDTQRFVLQQCKRQFAESRAMIQHCIDQLDDGQLWARLSDEQNSIANLMLHLSGNVRQWIVSGVGNTEDIRDRPSEFSTRGSVSRDQLIKQLDATLSDAYAVLESERACQFSESRRIQGIDVTVLAAILHSMTHFQGHAQETISLTRFLLGDAYRFDFVPSGPEQGAVRDSRD